MEKLFVLLVYLMGDDGVINLYASKAMTEPACHDLMAQVIELDAKKTEPHALALFCHEADPENLRELTPEPLRPKPLTITLE